MIVSFCLPHPVAVSAFMICRGLCACTKMDVCAVCEFCMRLFCFVQAKTFCRCGCIYFLAALMLECVDVMVMSSA